MKIAICDDENAFLENLRQRIYALDIPNCEICEFNSGTELLREFAEEKYDIIILDIEMPDMDGLQTAQKIREIDKAVILSFLTNYSEFAIKGYEVNAFRYILKNQPDYLYTQQLVSIFDEYNQKCRFYSFSNQNIAFKFHLIDIIFFEINGRKVTLHTVRENVEYYGNLSAIYDELKYCNFIKPHKSYVVNLEHIKRIDRDNLILSNGEKIMIGRTYKKEIVFKYLKFMSGR